MNCHVRQSRYACCRRPRDFISFQLELVQGLLGSLLGSLRLSVRQPNMQAVAPEARHSPCLKLLASTLLARRQHQHLPPALRVTCSLGSALV